MRAPQLLLKVYKGCSQRTGVHFAAEGPQGCGGKLQSSAEGAGGDGGGPSRRSSQLPRVGKRRC